MTPPALLPAPAPVESQNEPALEEIERLAAVGNRYPDPVEPCVPDETNPSSGNSPRRDADDEPKAESLVHAAQNLSAALPSAEGSAGDAARGPGTNAPSLVDPGALRPVYPVTCRRLRHQGVVVLEVLVGADGKPLEVKVARSGDCPDLDRAAVEAMRRARFLPARQWGRTTPCVIEQAIKFELRS